MHALRRTLIQIARLLGSQRKLWLPFLIAAFVEASLIALVWLAPHPPFAKLLAPPIRYFFGERVLHYPWHLWFLYHAMKHAHFIAATLVGAFMTGIACVMVRQVHEGSPLSLRNALVSRQVRYGRVVLLWLVSWGLGKGLLETFSAFAPRTAWAAWSALGLIVALQACIVYAIPAAVFEPSGWWRALVRGVRETLRYPLSTLLVVIGPCAALIAVAVAAPSVRVAQWMQHAQPEVAVVFVVARLAAWTVADALMTVAIAHLWWLHRAPQRATAFGPWAMGHGPLRRPHVPWPMPHGPSVIVLVFSLVIMAAGCSASYNGERLFWKAQQLSAPIAKDSATATPEQFASAIEAYSRVIARAPGTMWAARAQLAIGSLYAIQKAYPDARQAYDLVRQNSHSYQELVLMARVGIAKTYEDEAQWEEAIRTYHEIAEYHPWSAVGLEVPLSLSLLYQKRSQPEEATEALERAVRTYTKLIPDAPNPDLRARAQGYLAQTHQRLGQWDQAIAIYNEMLAASSGVNRPLTFLLLGSIYETKLHDTAKAGTVYTQLIEEFPDHNLAKIARTQLEHLGLAAAANSAAAAPR
jgi:tetratricopeptide (TPR) repeat protein